MMFNRSKEQEKKEAKKEKICSFRFRIVLVSFSRLYYYGPLTYYINQTLQKVRLTSDTGWVETVRSLMGKDRRLIKQNMVTEKSN